MATTRERLETSIALDETLVNLRTSYSGRQPKLSAADSVFTARP